MQDEPTSSHPGAGKAPPAPAASPLQSLTARLSSPGSRLMLLGGGFAALFACLAVFGAIAEDVRNQEANALDAFATPLLHGLSSPILDAIMGALTDIGSTMVVGPLCVVAVVLLVWRRHRPEAAFLVVSIAGSVALNESLKLIFHRPRPQLDWAHVQAEYNFPSGHAMNSLVFYVAIALVVWLLLGRRAGLIAVAAAIVLAILIGTSRIYFGYHYLTDVVGGFFAGAAWLLIVAGAFAGRLRPDRSRDGAPAP